MSCARAACALFLVALGCTAAAMAGGGAFSASRLGGALLLVPPLGVLLLAGCAVLPRWTTPGDGGDDRGRRLGAAAALAGLGLLVFGCSWVVLVHNL